MRAALQRLAELASVARGESSVRPVPDVGPMALPDQLAVLVADAREAGAPDGDVSELLAGLSGALSVGDR